LSGTSGGQPTNPFSGNYRTSDGGTINLCILTPGPHIRDTFEHLGLAEVAETVRGLRRAKGMLLVEGDADCRSAGSFFKNPVVSEERARQIAEVSGKLPPSFPAGRGQVKIPAAWLIEQAGFHKGFQMGAAGISSRHTLALTNRGGATANEILALAERIAAGVDARFGIELELEPVLVGF